MTVAGELKREAIGIIPGVLGHDGSRSPIGYEPDCTLAATSGNAIGLRQVSNVADVIAHPIFILECMPQVETHFLEGGNRFQNREAVLPPAADVVDLAAARRLKKLEEKLGNVIAVNLVTYLLSLIANDCVLLAG